MQKSTLCCRQSYTLYVLHRVFEYLIGSSCCSLLITVHIDIDKESLMLKKAFFSLAVCAASLVSSYQASALVKACRVVYDIDTTKFFGINLSVAGHGSITCEDLLGKVTTHPLRVSLLGVTPGLSFGHCHTTGTFDLIGTSVDAGFDWPAALTQFGGAAVTFAGRTAELGVSASVRDLGVKVTFGHSNTPASQSCLDLFRVGGEAISFTNPNAEL